MDNKIDEVDENFRLIRIKKVTSPLSKYDSFMGIALDNRGNEVTAFGETSYKAIKKTKLKRDKVNRYLKKEYDINKII